MVLLLPSVSLQICDSSLPICDLPLCLQTLDFKSRSPSADSFGVFSKHMKHDMRPVGHFHLPGIE